MRSTHFILSFFFYIACSIHAFSTEDSKNANAGAYVSDLDQAIHQILNHQKTWRTQMHEHSSAHLPPIFVSLFKMRPTGAAAFIIWRNFEKKNEPHILLTRQLRMVNEKKEEVFEPPAGFFNGAYPSKNIKHYHTEASEREIELSHSNSLDRKKIYADMATKISPQPYVEDGSLLDTALRETLEETGVNLEILHERKKLHISDLEPLDTQVAFVRVLKIVLETAEQPKTFDKPNNEVLWAGWVPLSSLSEDGLTMTLDGRTFSMKPLPWLQERFSRFIKTLKSQEN